MNTAGSVICDAEGGEMCVCVILFAREQFFFLCWTHFFSLIPHCIIVCFIFQYHDFYIYVEHIFLTCRWKIKSLSFFSLKVAWILSISDSELINGVCLTWFVSVLAEAAHVLRRQRSKWKKKCSSVSLLRIRLWHSVIFLFFLFWF